jgi:hypothetical protein
LCLSSVLNTIFAQPIMPRYKNSDSRILFLRSISLLLHLVQIANGFVTVSTFGKNIINHGAFRPTPSRTTTICFMVQRNPFQGLFDNLPSIPSFPVVNSSGPNEPIGRFCKARELVKSLVQEDRCFSTESGAIAFGNVCASDCVYEDCYEPNPIVGKKVSIVLKNLFP